MPLRFSPSSSSLTLSALAVMVSLLSLDGYTSINHTSPIAFKQTLSSSVKSHRDINAENIAQAYLLKRYPKLGINENLESGGVSSLKTYIVSSIKNRLGVSTVSFKQSYAGIAVYQKKATMLVRADNSIGLAQFNLAMNEPVTPFGHADILGEQTVNAVELAFAQLGYSVTALSADKPLLVHVASDHQGLIFKSSDIALEKVWYEHNGSLIPAFNFDLAFSDTLSNKQVHHRFVVAAGQNLILRHGSQMQYASHDYTVFGGDTGDLVTTNTLGATARFFPYFGGLDNTLLPFPYHPQSIHRRAFSTISTSDPWLTPERGAKYGTSGNHVNVCIETPFGQEPATEENCGRPGWETVPYSSPQAFNWQYNPNNPLSYESRRAAAVNTFYLYNQLHDFFYDFGFDEQAGNAQRNNYGRGGEQGDPLNVFVMESSFFNNGSADTGQDGSTTNIDLHPYFIQRSPSSDQFSLTLTADLDEGLPTDKVVNEVLPDVAYSYFGQQVIEETTGEVANLTFIRAHDGCSKLLNTENTFGKIVLYPLSGCELDNDNSVVQENMMALKEAGAAGIVFGVSDSRVNRYLEEPLFTTRFNEPLPHMFIAAKGQFDVLTANPLLCSDATGHCVPYSLTLRGPDTALVRDPAIGNNVSTHEWGHYLTARLAGDDAFSMQYRLMNEGWSDFVNIFFKIQPQDQQVIGNENWMGQYNATGWEESHIFGPRRVPYTTDMSQNALTIEHLNADEPVNAASLGHVLSDLAETAISPDNGDAHNAGEIWATLLLESYAALLNDTPRLSFNEAQQRMLTYVMTHLQVFDANDTYREVREKFLQVAYTHDRDDYDLIKRAFARRGMGYTFTPPVLDEDAGFEGVTGRNGYFLKGAQNSFDVDIRSVVGGIDFIESGVDIPTIISEKAYFEDGRDADLLNFQAQVAAALPACASPDDVRYGYITAFYKSEGDTDIGPLDLIFQEASSQHLLVASNGKVRIDNFRYDQNSVLIIPFAYLSSSENLSPIVYFTHDVEPGVTISQPLTSESEVYLAEGADSSGRVLPSDCVLGSRIQGVTQAESANVVVESNVFTFLDQASPQEQTKTVTVTNTSDQRQHFNIVNRPAQEQQGLEFRYPRALHVPANSRRTFEFRVINRSKHIQSGLSNIDGALEVSNNKNTLIIPYSISAFRSQRAN